MDITTILAGITPGPGTMPGADAPVDGDLAALFAAVLSAAAEAGVVTPTTGVSMPTTLGGAAGEDAAAAVPEGELAPVTAMPAELVALMQAATAQPVPAGASSAPGVVQTTAVPATPPVAVPDAPAAADTDGTPLVGPAVPGPQEAGAGPVGATPVRDEASATTGPGTAIIDVPAEAPPGAGETAAATDDLPAAATHDARPETAARPRDLSSSVPQSAVPDATTASVATTDLTGATADGSATADLRLVERVMEAVELLENAPPPRRIRLEVGDLRLAVSLRADGVHVSIDGDAAPTATWQSDLSSALEARGMSLADGGARDGREGRERPDPEETPTPPTPRPGRPPSDDADRGLRI